MSDLARGRARVVLTTDRLIEAPNRDPDGPSLVVNGDGRLWRVALEDAATLTPVDTGFADACNNDHGFSPVGARIAISHRAPEGSTIYLLAAAGGAFASMRYMG